MLTLLYNAISDRKEPRSFLNTTQPSQYEMNASFGRKMDGFDAKQAVTGTAEAENKQTDQINRSGCDTPCWAGKDPDLLVAPPPLKSKDHASETEGK